MIRSSSAWRSSSETSSSAGTSSGGSLMIRGSPSTSWTRRSNALRLFFLWALATFFRAAFICLRSATLARSASRASTSRRAYQTSKFRIAANFRIASRYSRTVLRTARRVSFGVKSRSRPAIDDTGCETLQVPFPGPGKGLVEVVDVQHQLAVGGREDPEVREVRVAAQLGLKPGLGRLREVHRHDRRRAAVEAKGRGQHPPVADRNEFLDTALGLVLEHLDRISPAGCRCPVSVTRARGLLTRRLAGGGALIGGRKLFRLGLGGGGCGCGGHG